MNAILFVIGLHSVAAHEAPAAQAAKNQEVFAPTKVWSFHIDMTAKDYEAMQPPGGARMPGFGGPGVAPPPAPKPGEPPRDSDRSAFGTEFPWVHATLTADGVAFKNVGVRYKGNSTYLSTARSLKRSLKIELDHYDAALNFHGLKTLNLHCGVFDPSKAREALAYSVFRAAGVPAPRTAFAEVTLTVPGKYDKEYVGVYVVVEQVNKTFLKEHFKSNTGLLMKPERIRGLDYLGDDWNRYVPLYQPKKDATKEESTRLIEFVRLINRGSDEQFAKEIGSYLDVDAFLRFMAANAMIANLDSFFTLGHNYYLYLNPETNKFVFIPWDVDLSLGNFAMMASAAQQMDLSLARPYAGANRLTDRLLALKDVGDKYQQVLKDVAATAFNRDKLVKEIDALEKTAKPLIDKETKAAAARKEGGGGVGFGPPGGMMARPPELRTFIEKRTASVVAQLAGKSKGVVPAGFGFGAGPGGGRPGGFGPGNFFAKPVLAGLDADKDALLTKEEWVAGVTKFFKDTDKDGKSKLDEKAVAEAINRLVPPPPGFGPRPPASAGGVLGEALTRARPAPPGFGPRPGAFGPGTALAGAIFKRADADKDGMVTQEELAAAAVAFFAECDKDKKLKLEEKDVITAINLLFPPPPGFGPPVARPGPELPKEAGKP